MRRVIGRSEVSPAALGTHWLGYGESTRDIAEDLQPIIMRPWLGNVRAPRASLLMHYVLAVLGRRFAVGLGSTLNLRDPIVTIGSIVCVSQSRAGGGGKSHVRYARST